MFLSTPHFTEPTTDYWQEFLPEGEAKASPWQYGFPARVPDQKILMLPIRSIPINSNHAVASLIVNQASIEVTATLGGWLATAVRDFGPEVIIGVPTMGLALAPFVAKGLGLDRFVPMGYSPKYWYDEALSAEMSSITSPGLGVKRAYVDPNQLSLIKGKKVALIDDVISSGKTIKAAWDLLERLGCEIQVCGVVMSQGTKWIDSLGPERVKKVAYVFESPLLEAVEGGWDIRQ